MNNEFKKYIELEVWKEARKPVSTSYSITKLFPKEEQLALISQMRRCAISVPSNFAEGCGRYHKKDSVQYFYISRGSLYELETQLYLSADLQFLLQDNLSIVLGQVEIVRKILNGFIRYYSD